MADGHIKIADERRRDQNLFERAKDTKQTRDITRSMSVVARELADPKPHD
jgi:hypothetical protein